MNIKDAAQLTQLPSKTIRYYEEIGLINPTRSANGYRSFDTKDIHKLGFVGRARALGFSIDDCRTLLALWEDENRANADVRRVAREHLKLVEEKIASLEEMRATLTGLVHECASGKRSDCPILASLSSQP